MKDSERGHLKIATPARLANDARVRRDMLLAESDWVALRAFESGMPLPAAWQRYRSALRDLPEQAGFPQTIEWPRKPGERGSE